MSSGLARSSSCVMSRRVVVSRVAFRRVARYPILACSLNRRIPSQGLRIHVGSRKVVVWYPDARPRVARLNFDSEAFAEAEFRFRLQISGTKKPPRHRGSLFVMRGS